MGLDLSSVVFDTANPTEGSNVGAYLKASDGTLLTHTGGALDINIASVDAASLGIFAEDSAHASGDLGSQILAVRNDAGTSLVSADGDYSPLSVDSTGALRVAGSFAPQDNKAEDSAAVSGDTGSYVLSVRQDTLVSSTSADGDYQSFKTDALGRLRMSSAKQSGAIGATSITTTATDIIGTDLANRTSVILYNNGSKTCYVGLSNAVTASTGIPLTVGASLEIEATSAVNLHAITATGTADVRYLELV